MIGSVRLAEVAAVSLLHGAVMIISSLISTWLVPLREAGTVLLAAITYSIQPVHLSITSARCSSRRPWEV